MLKIITRNNLFTLSNTIIFSLFCSIAYSHHIAGVDLSMQAINTNNKNFRITLNIYIEDKNSPITGANLEEIVVIFRKRDNALMGRFFVQRTQPPKFLTFQNPNCADLFKLKIYHSIFNLDVFLDPNTYNDAQGYYIMFDRCCRSEELTNINDPLNTAIAVMLEFPAVSSIKNSSPVFSIPDGEFICENEPFSGNFKATDVDGDNLKYSLVDPYAGFASFATSPYFDETSRSNRPGVNWLSGYNKDNAIPGNPALKINSQTGEVTVTANKTGLFVFAILCEEFRDGKRIGSNRKDYILKVVDCPTITLSKPVLNYNNAEIKGLALCLGNNADIETTDNTDWFFQWRKDGDNISNANSNKLTVSSEGVYTLVKSSKIACTKEAISEPLNITTTSNSVAIKIKSNIACEGDDELLTLENPNQTAAWYSSNIFIKEDKSMIVTKNGEYEAKVIGVVICPSANLSDKVSVTFHPKPLVSLPTNLNYQICTGDAITLTTLNNNNYMYQWYINATPIIGANSNTYLAGEIGSFKVKVKDQFCESESQIFKIITGTNCTSLTNPSDRLYIPNSFSPNNDGLNDEWNIYNIENFSDCEVLIYNRWGEVIYNSIGYKKPWDGTFNGQKVSSGNYAYKITSKKLIGNELQGIVMVLN